MAFIFVKSSVDISLTLPCSLKIGQQASVRRKLKKTRTTLYSVAQGNCKEDFVVLLNKSEVNKKYPIELILIGIISMILKEQLKKSTR